MSDRAERGLHWDGFGRDHDCSAPGPREDRLEVVDVLKNQVPKVEVADDSRTACSGEREEFLDDRGEASALLERGVGFFADRGIVMFRELFDTQLQSRQGGSELVAGVLGVIGQIGDLAESLFKREAGVKDSGQYFPGIGGILDLLDSLLFNAPIMYLYLRHVLTRP